MPISSKQNLLFKIPTQIFYVGFEIPTAVSRPMKSSVIRQRIPLEVNQLFGETCRLHLQGLRISQARNHHKTGSKQSLTFNGIQGDVFQKVELFKIYYAVCISPMYATFPAHVTRNFIIL
jgi:hypothetical protein